MKNTFLENRPLITISDIYDAYVIMYVYAFTTDSVVKEECIYLTKPIKMKLLWELENICLRELRHLKGRCIPFFYNHMDGKLREALWALDLPRTTLKAFRRKLKDAAYGLMDHYGDEDDVVRVAGRTKCICRYEDHWMNLKEFQRWFKVKWDMKTIADMFCEWEWDEEYAGKGWASIAQAAHNLATASHDNFFSEFDRAVDLVHNNGTALHKMNTNPSYIHFKKALTKKNRAKTVRPLLPDCSGRARRVYAKAKRAENLFWFHEYKLELRKK